MLSYVRAGAVLRDKGSPRKRFGYLTRILAEAAAHPEAPQSLWLEGILRRACHPQMVFVCDCQGVGVDAADEVLVDVSVLARRVGPENQVRPRPHWRGLWL
jgi:hypothetical protein